MKKNSNIKKICLYCFINNEEVSEIKDNDYQIIPVEFPYKNIFFHKDCTKKIENMNDYIIKNVDIWIEL